MLPELEQLSPQPVTLPLHPTWGHPLPWWRRILGGNLDNKPTHQDLYDFVAKHCDLVQLPREDIAQRKVNTPLRLALERVA